MREKIESVILKFNCRLEFFDRMNEPVEIYTE